MYFNNSQFQNIITHPQKIDGELKPGENRMNELAGYADEAVALRRSIHRRPEEGWTEFETTYRIVACLEKYGYDVKAGIEAVEPSAVLGRNPELVAKAEARALAHGVPQAYVDALLRELAKNTRRPDTLYFGGGTPALLSPGQVSTLIQAADPLPGAEITLEANPDVVTPETLLGFRQAGVNRISFGVQSADDAQLQRLGRTHTAAGAARALAWAQEAGFPDICGDIMLALPQYTNAEFDRTLALLQNGGCTHISAYLLKVEPGTAFYRNPPAGLPDADAAADFYLYAVRQLEAAGYRQYEISNFARLGHEGRHNLLYWNCEPYRGIGPAAHSCVDNVRRFWPGDVQGFIDGTIHEEIEGDCTAEDYLLMQLRLTRGLDLEEYARRGGHFATAQQAFMRQCVTHGYAVWEGSSFRLTPAGMVVQNAILTELI